MDLKKPTILFAESLFNILKEFNFPNKLINLIEATQKNTEIKIKVAFEVSDEPKTMEEMCCHPVLFNLILEKQIVKTE